MILREITSNALNIIREYPCLGIVGPRQIGKTTFSNQLLKQINIESIYLDLESPSDYDLLNNAEDYFLSNQNKLIVIDEVQRKKELFPILRSVIDRNRVPGRFILLGSASPELIRDSSESLAGRIAYVEISGLTLNEYPHQMQLWLKGGYPLIHQSKMDVTRWYKNYLNTYIERDLPLLGMPGQAITIRRMTFMLAQFHGQTLNMAILAKSLELSIPTIKKYLDFLEGAFLIRRLHVFAINAKKRLSKSPKIYFRDTGLLHYLMGIKNAEELNQFVNFGASWEGFAIEQIAGICGDDIDLYYYRTQHGAELDLVLVRGVTPIVAIEIKHGDKTSPSRGNIISAVDVEAENKFVIHSKSDKPTWTNQNGWTMCSLAHFLSNELNY
ncbi:MAG: ATP-binding protein [Flavobacteriales bacterium]|nr:ATP-binding protein [Flavobacteriales bacterium]